MKRERNYLILKLKDLETAQLDDLERAVLEGICEKVEKSREARGAQPLECVVVESDWPEYDATWWAIAARMDREHGISPLRSKLSQIEKYGSSPPK